MKTLLVILASVGLFGLAIFFSLQGHEATRLATAQARETAVANEQRLAVSLIALEQEQRTGVELKVANNTLAGQRKALCELIAAKKVVLPDPVLCR